MVETLENKHQLVLAIVKPKWLPASWLPPTLRDASRTSSTVQVSHNDIVRCDLAVSATYRAPTTCMKRAIIGQIGALLAGQARSLLPLAPLVQQF
jgi:hypothetical protein